MSLSNSLSNALSGLTAASRMAEIVSSNLANALTEGYGRRELELSPRSVVGRGAGVQIDGVTRIVDRGLLSDRRLSDAALSRDNRMAGALVRLEQTIGTPSAEDSLAARIAQLETSLVAAASDPAADLRLGHVLGALNAITSTFQDQSSAIARQRTEVETAIAGDVETLNAALGEVERLNGAISNALTTGQDAAGLMDTRQTLVDRISSIVPIRSFDRPYGQIALTTQGGAVLLEGKASEIGFDRAGLVTPDMSFANGLLGGLTLNGRPVAPDDGVGRFGGGSLGAAFALRDQTLPEASARLDSLAADMIARFEEAGVDPTLLPGAPGLLTDNGGPLDPGDLTGLAGRIAVNAAVDPDRGGALFRLRDGVAALTPGPTGRSDQIEGWNGALGQTRSLIGGGTPMGAAAHASELLSFVSSARLGAEEARGFTSARQSALKQAELAEGVDTDHELQMLLMVEQAYAANARVITTIDSLMQTLLEI